MKKRTFPFLITLIFTTTIWLSGVQSAQATHLRAGEITVTRKSCNSLTYIITITAYTNTGSPILFSSGGLGELNFGDGSPIHHPPEQHNSPVPGFGPEFGYVSYSVEHTFANGGHFVISYFEHNRNAGILNMSNSVGTPFYIETIINIDSVQICDNLPQLLVPPINTACTGVAWYHNPGAYDTDGDSLSFELTIPKQNTGQDVENYRAPNVAEFYSSVGLNYGTANEAANGKPTFQIDAITGTLIWDAPGPSGEYTVAFHIIEWRKIAGAWTQLGYVTRDMQIIVEDCSNHRPALTQPADVCVAAGTVIDQDIFGSDPDFDSVKIEAFSQALIIAPSPATMTPNPAVFQVTAPAYQAVAHFNWSTQCEHVRAQRYQNVLRITDRPPAGKGTNLVQFKTWNIRVVGPAPKLTNVLPQPGRTAKLTWENYACSNALTMQVWRRVGSYPFDPSQCLTGMPDFLGFSMIAEVPITTTQYTDTNAGKGLAPGATYCYRLVAVFPQPEGGESYVSNESCFTLLANAPILTNVTIGKTDKTSGQDTIRWLSPLLSETDTIAFPPPYQYLVYRAEGFSGNVNETQVFANKTNATFYVDNGLNTDEKIYNYRVVAFSNSSAVVDTSAAASTVRLELKPHLYNIELNWSAEVPWSNQAISYPLHTIYRGPSTSTRLSDMQVIDNVDVSQNTFHYIDSGQWNNTPLDSMQTYCYCVKTEGSYGNSHITGPLINYSQINCVKPDVITGDLTSLPNPVTIYPNPTHDYLMIKGITQETGPSFVMDLLGRSTPISLEKDQDLLKADVRFLSGGMYILSVAEGNTIHQIKFIKQ